MPDPSGPSVSRAPNAALADDAARDRRAAETLARVERESETIGASTLPRAGGVRREDDSDEPVVRWGRRLGRSLGIAVAVFLLWKVAGPFLFGMGSQP